MKLTLELYLLLAISTLTALMWVPYVIARILTRGLLPAMANPDPSHRPEPAWAQRARLAHGNAIENLAVFAPLVLIAAIAGISTPATILAAKVYVFARFVHFVVFAAGIPIIRTLAFLAGAGATLVFAVTLLSQAA